MRPGRRPAIQVTVGDRFGTLTVLAEAAPARSASGVARRVLVKCDCGNERVVYVKSLRSGGTTSCSCARVEFGRTNATHGEGRHGLRTPEYSAWLGIKARCLNQKSKYYAYYGGRGIGVWPPWASRYELFLEDFLRECGRRPSPRHSIDRVNNDLGLHPWQPALGHEVRAAEEPTAGAERRESLG